MRRHHFLGTVKARGSLLPITDISDAALSMPGSIATNDRGETSYPQGRRRSTQLPPSPYENVHHRLPRLFSGNVPGVRTDAEDDPSDEEDDEDDSSKENCLGRVQSYSKLMHAHTHAQMRSPSVSTLPSYTRTMHAFTLNQLDGMQKVTKSATNSPQFGAGAKAAMMPRLLCTELSSLCLDEVPNPSNTPETDHRRTDPRYARKRSVTEPVDFMTNVAKRDFAVS